ncbi:MAG TPA: hypothetical protein VGA67_03535, partial [Candidatus Dojkabacteria bacterium]
MNKEGDFRESDSRLRMSDSHFPTISELDLIEDQTHMLLNERVRKTSSYYQHAHDVLNNGFLYLGSTPDTRFARSKRFPIISTSLRIAFMFHDMFDGRTANLNGDSEDFFKRLGPNSISAIKNLLASSIHDKTIETALGYIIASEKAETFAEEWRFSIQHAIYEGKNNLDFELIDSKIRTLSGNDNDKYEQLKTDLLRILSSKDKYGLHSED